MKGKGGAFLLAALLLLSPLGLIGLGIIVLAAGEDCTPSALVDVDGASGKKVAGFEGEQLKNAALIIEAGADMGLSVNDQTIAVMTAIGESTLRILNYGDEAGPDSRGLFQQRDNWGPLADRMDAKKSATLFYNALIKIDENDRKTLPPSIVAHRVQINANPYHYEPFWKPAQEIVKALTDGKSGGSSCSAGPNPGGSTSISKKGWAAPSRGPITSAYGGRDGKFHSGVDLSGGGCGGPIWAAYPGAVSYVGLDDLNNGVIYIIHEGKLETRYVHMFPSQIYVRAGQKVKAGQQIAAVGASGQAFGCHLHFEVKEVRGITDWSGFHDPIPFLRERGITF